MLERLKRIFLKIGLRLKERKKNLTLKSWSVDIQIKGHTIRRIPENERTLEMCFVAIHYWGAALEFVPEKYKTYEMCLYAVRHNAPVDESCSALAFVPDELKTYELCLEAIRHDYFPSPFWENGYAVGSEYAAAINFVPEKLRTPELCYEALIHYPSSEPGYFNFIEPEFDYGPISVVCVEPKTINDILNSSEIFIESLKRIGMPEEYKEDALKYFEKLKIDKREISR